MTVLLRLTVGYGVNTVNWLWMQVVNGNSRKTYHMLCSFLVLFSSYCSLVWFCILICRDDEPRFLRLCLASFPFQSPLPLHPLMCTLCTSEHLQANGAWEVEVCWKSLLLWAAIIWGQISLKSRHDNSAVNSLCNKSPVREGRYVIWPKNTWRLALLSSLMGL